jgi:putative endonuclease
MVAATDLKSVGSNPVPVRVRPPAPGFVLRTTPGAAGLQDDTMHYVYMIRSLSNRSQIYVGATADLKQRMADHNSGKSPHTAKYLPWEIEFYAAFPRKQTAHDFEKYLKSHSGRAFAKKRLLPPVD